MGKIRVDSLVEGNLVKHNHGVDDFLSEVDSRYVNAAGDTMTGDLDIQDNVIIMTAPDATRWRVAIANGGSLITEQIITGAGTPFGLLLTITNAV